jgi:hypothetical protein
VSPSKISEEGLKRSEKLKTRSMNLFTDKFSYFEKTSMRDTEETKSFGTE